MKNVMKNAWVLAKEAAEKHGGSAREYLSDALKTAWNAKGKTGREVMNQARKALRWANKKFLGLDCVFSLRDLEVIDAIDMALSVHKGNEFKVARKMILDYAYRS